MDVVINGADFASLGLGNTRWSENYISAAGITDTTTKAAIRAFFLSMVSKGLDKKFEVIRLNVGGTALADSLNVVNISTFKAAFINDVSGNHTATGLRYSRNGVRANSNYKITSLRNFHFSVFVLDLGTGRTDDYGILGSIGEPTTDVRFALHPNNSIATLDATLLKIGNPELGAGYLTANSLYSAAVINTNFTTYKNGAVVNTTASATPNPVTADPTLAKTLTEGGLWAVESSDDTNRKAYTANTKVLFTGYGSATWTDTDEANLNTILVALKTAVGA